MSTWENRWPATDKLYHIMLYRVNLVWAGFELTTLVHFQILNSLLSSYCNQQSNNTTWKKRASKVLAQKNMTRHMLIHTCEHNKAEHKDEVYSVQHYVIKFVSGRSAVFSGTHIISINKTDRHDIAEMLLKVALNTITLTPVKECGKFCFICLNLPCRQIWISLSIALQRKTIQYYTCTQIKVKEQHIYCHSSYRVFHNEQNSYLPMRVKWPL
jgi:hypothetical protein